MEEKSTEKPNSEEVIKYDKNNLEKCINKFRSHILEKLSNIPEIKKSIIDLSLKGEISTELLRPTSWKILLHALSCDENSSLKVWLEDTASKRKAYKKLVRENITIRKFKGDPLGGFSTSNNPWDNFFDESNIKHLIKIDVDRTYQDRELFCDPDIKEMENNILYLFAKENQPTSYKQGMNDILAMLIYSLYPFYTKSNYKKYTKEIFDKWCGDPLLYANEIYCFFHDENNFAGDLYYMMINLMKLGVNKFYEDIDTKKNPNEKKNYLIKRCEKVSERKLKIQNSRLYYHFINIGIDCSIVLQRWIKCLFIREFHPQDCGIVWDAILANEEMEPSGELAYIDFFSIAMLVFISDELLRKDQNECFKRLFHYPPLEAMSTLLNLTEKIRPDLIKLEQLENEKETMRIEKVKQQKKQLDEMASKNQKLREKKEQSSKNLMNDFFMGTQVNNKIIPQSPTPMFSGGNIFNKELLFGIGGGVNLNLSSGKKEKTAIDTIKESYKDSDNENRKILMEIKGLLYKYKGEFSKQDKMKIDYLLDRVEKNV